jgi:nanoRNase/pAp phosphatase (c-di-AMP/oligoRNAs hydrolase)
MDAQSKEMQDKFRVLFKDTKAQEFAVNVILPWLEKAGEDGVVKNAYIAGGARSDPDASASAKAIAYLTLEGLARIYNEAKSTQVRFEHNFFGEGLVGPENIVFRKECNIQLSRISELLPKNYDHILSFESHDIGIVDSEPDALWDTHSRLPKSRKIFADIRREYTATSAIVIHYIQPFLKDDNDEIRLLATALKYGIDSDFTSAGGRTKRKEEHEIERILNPFVDQDILEKIHRARTVRSDYWDILATQCINDVRGSFQIFGMGFLETGQENYLWRTANDIEHRTDGILTVLCFGIVGNSVIYKTRAHEDSSVDLDELDALLQLKSPESPKLDSNSGARSGSGGGAIQLLPTPRADVAQAEKREYFKRVFEDITARIKKLTTGS